MPATVTYNTINGKIYSETRNGVSTAFVSDPLGNVIKCRDSQGNKTYEAWYWPYGEIREETGTNPSNLGYVGTLGYYTDLPMPSSTSPANRIYVRARYYRPDLTRWQTLDLLWPDESVYQYVSNSPIDYADESGLGRHTGHPRAGKCVRAMFCERNVGGSFCGNPFVYPWIYHWFLEIPGCGALGYGPDGFMGTGLGNLGEIPIAFLNCRSFCITQQQARCLCHLKGILADAQAKDRIPPLTPAQKHFCCPWQGNKYNLIYHNCQDFVETMLNHCGLDSPEPQVDSFSAANSIGTQEGPGNGNYPWLK